MHISPKIQYFCHVDASKYGTIKTEGQYSKIFQITNGLKQEDALSSDLFNLNETKYENLWQ